MTLTDIAVDMWNHAPRMLQTPPVFTQNEMRELLSYLWMRQLVYPGGSIADGQKVFTDQKCSTCHAGGMHGARQLPGQAAKYSEVTIISALWRHGPQMLRRMKTAGISWPRFQESAGSGGPDRVLEFGAVGPWICVGATQPYVSRDGWAYPRVQTGSRSRFPSTSAIRRNMASE